MSTSHLRARGLLKTLSVVLVVGLLAAAGDADARRRREGRRALPPTVLVAPYEGDAQRGRGLVRSLELELELADSVRVRHTGKVKRYLRKKGGEAYQRATLRKIMKRNRLQLLVRGVEGWTEAGDEVTWIVVYSADGRARFFQPFANQSDVDAMGLEIAAALAPAFKRFSRRDPVEVVFPERPRPTSDSDLFVEPIDDEEPRAAPQKRKSSALAEIRAEKARREGRSGGAEDDPAPDRLRDDEGSAGEERRVAGDPDPVEAGSQADGERERALAPADPEDDEGAAGDDEGEPDLSHFIAVSGGLGGGILARSFQASRPSQSEPLFWRGFGGGGLRLSFWPIEWVGVEADARAHGVRYAVPGIVTPEQFLAARVSTGVAGKARYILHLGPVGVGGGARLGGRYLGQLLVPEQRHVDGDLLTFVPAYHWLNLTVGAELWLSFVVLGRRIEIEPKLDLMPLSVMFELPDWPGRYSRTLGWHVSNTARAEIFYGLFAELYAWHTGGVTSWFDGAGTRRGRLIDSQSGRREHIEGGTVLNLDAGAQLAVGWMW